MKVPVKNQQPASAKTRVIGVPGHPPLDEAMSPSPEQPYIKKTEKREVATNGMTQDKTSVKRRAVASNDQGTHIPADDDWDAPAKDPGVIEKR